MLVAHSTTKRCAEYEVLAVPEPEFTSSWHPVSHGKVINMLENSLASDQLSISNREYSLSENGKKMFGVFDVAPTPGYVENNE